MIVDQNDVIDAYIVVLLSYLGTLVQRKEASWRRPEASRLWRIYDRLSLSVADRRQVFLRLITPLLANITDPLPPATLDKTPRELLVEHANTLGRRADGRHGSGSNR
ncbi:MAG TPA: hypothetical protein VKI44_27015 [Acetobacteraceae bacterium]|nr:hypothetical protein [Acetobacteraceae bacterium]